MNIYYKEKNEYYTCRVYYDKLVFYNKIYKEYSKMHCYYILLESSFEFIHETFPNKCTIKLYTVLPYI